MARIFVAYDVEGLSWAELFGLATDGLNASVGVTSRSRTLPPPKALAAFNEALDTAYLKQRWSTEDGLVEVAVRAIAAGVGDGSTYVTRAEVRRIPPGDHERTFGLALGMAQPFPVVLGVEVGSVAEAAFIRAGEEVTAVDGRPTNGRDIWEVRRWLESVVDGNVVLSLLDADQTTRTVTLNRSSLSAVGAIGCRVLDGSVLYLRIHRFTLSTPAQIREAAQSAGGIAQRLVLDLRGNPGGDLETAFNVSDLLVRDGELGEIERARSHDRRAARPGDLLERSRVVALVDGETEGAGELVAANIQDHRRGKVVGRKTAGIAEVRQAWLLPAGDVVQIVSSRVRRAGGSPLSRLGVTPDINVEADAGVAGRAFDDVPCPGTAAGSEVHGDALVARAVQLLESP